MLMLSHDPFCPVILGFMETSDLFSISITLTVLQFVDSSLEPSLNIHVMIIAYMLLLSLWVSHGHVRKIQCNFVCCKTWIVQKGQKSVKGRANR